MEEKGMNCKKALLLTGLCLLLMACDIGKPLFPTREKGAPIEPTISSDGKMVVVLDRTGQETPRLRIKWLDREDPWLEMAAPKYASSIRFGLTGYNLLLTHARPGPQGASQLSRWDASNPTKPSEILFEGTRVAFPVEVKPGQVLVRMCPQPPSEKACVRGHGLVWALIENGQATPIKETLGMYPLGSPNVVENGFFWTLDSSLSAPSIDNPSASKILSYGFPGKEAPQFDASILDSKTGSTVCDRKARRCLLKYLTDERVNGNYVYGFKVLDGANTCVLSNIKGWQDTSSVTPDGRAAVIPLSRVSEEPRHIVVLGFTPGQCEPTSVQHIQFHKETSK